MSKLDGSQQISSISSDARSLASYERYERSETHRLKRAVLLASLAAAFTVAALVTVLVLRSHDAKVVAPDEANEKVAASDRTGEQAELAPLPVAEVAQTRVEALEGTPSEPLNAWGLADGGPLAKFRGRLVYESTGQGVPWCEVGLRGVGRQVEFRITDEEGRFESRLGFPLGSTLVLVVDRHAQTFDWDRAIEVHRDNDAAESVIEARVGPTLMIAGELPSGVDLSKVSASICAIDDRPYCFMHMRPGGASWFARELLPEPPDLEKVRARLAESRARLPSEMLNLDVSKLSPEAQRLFEQWRVERGNVESIDADAKRIVGASTNLGPPWKVRFVSEHETWTGTAVLDNLDGVIAVAPQWNSLGDVAVSFHGNWTTPPAWNVDVELRAGAAGDSQSPHAARLDQLAGQPLHVFGVKPGRYILAVRSEVCDDVELPIAVGAPETTNVEVALDCAVSAGSIRVEITSESGTKPSDSLLLNLWRPGVMSLGGWIETVDESHSPWKASAEIQDLPAGDYHLSLEVGAFGIAPSFTQPVHAGEVVHLRVLDQPMYVDLGFRVFDAESGVELETFDIDVNKCGYVQSPRGLRSGSIVVEHFPENGRLSWDVTSPGHVCEEGDLANQTAWGRSHGDRRWIDVRLQRGWRVKFSVLDPEGRGLKGATIVADGNDMGTSDADGYFTLTLPQRPKSLAARYLDWRCTETDIDRLPEVESCDEFLFVFDGKK